MLLKSSGINNAHINDHRPSGIINLNKPQNYTSHGAVCYGRTYEEVFRIAHNLEEACGNYIETVSPMLKRDLDEYGTEDGSIYLTDEEKMQGYEAVLNKDKVVMFAHEEIKSIVEWIDQIVAEAGKEKKEFELKTVPEDLEADVRAFAESKMREAVHTQEKQERLDNMSRRMGFFVDLDNAFITLNNDYIETEWWILKEFFKAGLIYEGHQVLPYCPRCGTGLASHEVAQGYKEIPVLTLTMMFKRKDVDNEYFLAWTTTPWTVAANVALTVGPDLEYIRARMTAGEHEGEIFITGAKNADQVLGEGQYEVLETMKGTDLEYLEYERLLDFEDIEVPGKVFYVTWEK